MLNSVYQLITPKTISVKHEDVDTKDQVIIRPEYLALCHADQRYYQGKRDIKILRKKLPMALIHEACGRYQIYLETEKRRLFTRIMEKAVDS